MTPPDLTERADIDKALAEWLRERVRHPVVFIGGAPVCDFCHTRFMILWNGSIDGDHAAGCLALRAVAWRAP